MQPKRNVKCGDLRLIADENTPSKHWPLERIIKTFPGKDGLVRTAQVKTSWSVLTRSVDKLSAQGCSWLNPYTVKPV